MSSYDRKHRIVFEKAPTMGRMDPGNHRYIPKATGRHHGHWGIYDRKRDRFLTDREIKQTSEETLATEQLPLN